MAQPIGLLRQNLVEPIEAARFSRLAVEFRHVTLQEFGNRRVLVLQTPETPLDYLLLTDSLLDSVARSVRMPGQFLQRRNNALVFVKRLLLAS